MIMERAHGKSFLERRSWILMTVLLAAFVLRLGVALIIDSSTTVYKDVDIYSTMAENVARGNGFVVEPGGDAVLHRAPLYPAFLAAVYTLVDKEQRAVAVLIAQAALDSLTAVLVWWIGYQLFNSAVGLGGALLFALYPLSAYYTLRLMPEPLFTFILVAYVASLVHAMRSENMYNFGLNGALGAIATLVKPITIGLVPFVAVLLAIKKRRALRPVIPQLAVMLAVFVLLVAPWSIRNYAVSGMFVPVATGGGAAMWVGNNRISDGRDDDEIRDEAQLAAFIKRRREIVDKLRREQAGGQYEPGTKLAADHFSPDEPIDTTLSLNAPVNIDPGLDRAYARAAIEEMMASPLDALNLLVRKFFRFWFDIYLPENRWAQSVIYLFQAGLLLLAGYGLFVGVRSKVSTLALIAPMVYLAGVYSLVVATLRYSIPLVPILMLLAVVALFDLAARLGVRPESINRELEQSSDR